MPARRTTIVATANVKQYRETIPHYVNSDDVVLELGCEWGTTSVLLAERARELVATDVSHECIEQARKKHPGIRFEVLDGFDLSAALALGRDFTKIYIDISGLSGYRSLLDAIALVQGYASVFRPGAIVIKSQSLGQFIRRCVAWPPATSPRAER